MAKAKKAKPAAKPAEPVAKVTKKVALDYLRMVETKLYSTRTERGVKNLAYIEQVEFFNSRLGFSAVILRLNKTLMSDMAEDLQAQARSLKVGIDKLSASLGKLENAVQWAKTINSITASIGKVVSLF